jgi:hypothetical protein
MTNLDDFDRSLSDFLADGPNTAPEAPVIAAMAHARTTPRRPDPLRAFRADPMSPRRTGLVGARPGLLLAVVAVAVGAVGVAVVGSRQPSDSVLPVPSTNDVATPTPGSSGIASPIPTGPPAFQADVTMLVSAGQPFPITVSDVIGDLIGAVSLQPGDGASVGTNDIQVIADPANPAAFIVTWQGTPCETGGSVRVDEARKLIEIGRQRCVGEPLPLDRVLRLEFRSPLSEGEWASTFVDAPASSLGPGESPSTAMTPLGSPAVAPVRVELIHEGGGPVSVDIVDESGSLVSSVSGPVPTEEVGDGITAVNETGNRVRLSWMGSPCDTVHRLTIDPAGTAFTLDRPLCRGDSMAAFRSLVLTFDRAIDAGAITAAIIEGRGGVDLPTWTTLAPDSAGGSYRLTASDPGYVINTLDGFYDPGTPADAAGPTGIVLSMVNATTLRLTWQAPACATQPSLEIEPGGAVWRLVNAPCTSSEPDVLRMIEVEPNASRMPSTAPEIALVVAGT